MNASYPSSRRAFLKRTGLATMAVAGGRPSWPAAPAAAATTMTAVAAAEQTSRGEPVRRAGDGAAVGRHLQRRLRRRVRQVPRGALQREVRGRRDRPQGDHRHPPADAAALQRRQPARRPRQRRRRGDAHLDPRRHRPADRPHRAVRRRRDRRGRHDGPGHPQPGGDRVGRVRRQADGAQLRAAGLRPLVRPGAVRREGLGARRDVGRTSWRSARRSRAPASRRWPTRASTPTTSSRC